MQGGNAHKIITFFALTLLAMPFYGELKRLRGLFFRVEIRSA